MNITLIATLMDPTLSAGAARSARRLAQALYDSDVNVSIITTGDVSHPTQTTIDGIPTLVFKPHNLYWYANRAQYPVWKKAIWQLRSVYNGHVYDVVRQFLAHHPPDIVHTQKLRGLSPSVWYAALSVGVPHIIHTPRDLELLSPEATLQTKIGAYFASGSWYTQLNARFSRTVSHVIAPSHYVIQRHAQVGIFSHTPHTIIPNTHGYSEEQLAQIRVAQSPSTDGRLRLLYLGRLEPEKGPDLICKAAAALPNQVLLDVVGFGSLEDTLRRRYYAHENITFHGRVEGAEKFRYYDACDAFVIPSVYDEIFGTVTVESYARGKPVIGSAVGGIPELIQAGETGFLFPRGDSHALIGLLRRLNRPTLRAMSAACYDAAKCYSTTAFSTRHLDFYQSILSA